MLEAKQVKDGDSRDVMRETFLPRYKSRMFFPTKLLRVRSGRATSVADHRVISQDTIPVRLVIVAGSDRCETRSLPTGYSYFHV